MNTIRIKHFLFLFPTFLFITAYVVAQSDDCSTATPLIVTATCTAPTSGTTLGATQTIPGCVGNADDDVWYSFVATSTSHRITVTPSTNMDAVFQLFSGTCSGLVSLACVDNNFFEGGVETLNYSALTVGVSYRIRVYHYGVGSGSGNFSICVTPGVPPPANDICSNAIALAVNSICSPTSGTLHGATQSMSGCSGTADDDVWYSFVATAPSHTITATTNDMIDIVFEVFSGTCSDLTSIVCVDNNYVKGGTETTTLVGLSIGTKYYFRLYDFYANNPGDFSICVTGTTGSVPNDEPCNAIVLPPVTSACNYLEFSNVGATASISAPTPSNCAGGSGAQIGGFNASTADVWFEITVPANGHINITNKPTVNGYISDATMALYSGTCNSLTQIACSDDYNYPPRTGSPSPNRFRPMLNTTGLTPGSKVYLRYWGFGSNTGKFGFCVTTGLNDDCTDALYICDINGYSASTSDAFSSDYPGNMHGNNETDTGTYLAPGINSGGPFGYYPPSNIAGPYSSPSIDVEIDNNSWIRFTAGATTVTLNVSIYDCFREAAGRSSGGIQMQIFDYTGCSQSSVFTPISEFKEGWGAFTLQTIDPLVVGQDYILMVDGFAGDICNYTISAESGVQFPQIPPPAPICSGSPITLTAPPDGNSYLWLHNGSTAQSVTVNPSTTTTYSVQVEGLCGQRQTLSVEVKVKSPFVEITAPNTTICAGGSVVLTASASATTYLWTDVATNTTIGTTQAVTVSPSAPSHDYKVKATVDNCEASKIITISVAPPPTVTLTASPKDSMCVGGSITLTASGASAYTWNNGLSPGATHTVSPTTTTTYTVTGSNGNCNDVATKKIEVVSPPTISGTANITPSACDANTGQISGLSSSATSVSYSWKNSANVEVGTTANVTGLAPDTYTLTITDANGCVATSGTYTIATSSPPIVTLTSSANAICSGGTTILTASGALTYTWDNGLTSGSSHTVAPSSTTSYTVIGTDANGCSNTDSVTITIHPTSTAVLITPSKSGAMCIGDPSITLTATGALSYSWNTGATTDMIAVAPPITTTYSVVGTDANGCSVNASYSVAVNTLPTISGDALLVSPSNCDVDNGAISGIMVSGISPFSYSWTNASNNVVGTSQDITGLSPGTYTLEVMDANTCIASFGPITISHPPDPSMPNVFVGKNVLCRGETATLSLLSTYALGTTFEWTLPNGSLSSSVPLTINEFSTANQGDYCLSATYLGCSSTANCLNLSMHPISDVQIINSGADLIVCEDGVGVLVATGASSYVWTGPNAFLWSGPTIQIAPFTSIHQGWYVVEGKDANGCTQKDSAMLHFVNNPTISVSADANNGIYCVSSQATLTAIGASTYIWTGPNNSTFSGSSVLVSDLNEQKTGWYSVVATDENNCSSTDSIQIKLSIPNMNFDLEDKIVVCPGEDVLFSANIDQAFSYYWTGPTGYVSDQNEFTLYTVDMPQVGWYYLTISDSIACPQTDSLYLSVELKAECLHIPDLITPDSDLLNDTWKIPYIYYFPNVEVQIYNRWGNLVYQTEHYQNEWRGQINRNKQTVINSEGIVPTGTYFFVMTLNDPQKTPPIQGYIDVQY